MTVPSPATPEHQTADRRRGRAGVSKAGLTTLLNDSDALDAALSALEAENQRLRAAITDALRCLEYIADTRPAVAHLRAALSVGVEEQQ